MTSFLSKNKLFGKLFILIFLAIFLIMFTFTLQSITYQKKSILDSLSSQSKSIADSISFVKTDAMIIDNQIDILEFVIEFVKQNNQIKNFIVVRKNGTSLSIKEDGWSVLSKNYYDTYQTSFINYEILHSEYLNHKIFKYTYPIYIKSVLWGWFHFEINLDDYNKKVEEMYANIRFLAITLLLTSIFVSFLITTMVASPIIKLSKISKDIADGKLNTRANIKRNDEIGELSNTFNKMLDSLEKSQSALKKSHDELEQRVESRTFELRTLNDTLKEKSEQLKELNENLENRVNQEISKRQKNQQLLIQQTKLAAMGEMIGNIAHQWRQPLNALSLVIQNIDFTYKIGELNDGFMEKSIGKANLLTYNMSKTIDDFRNFFKPDKEKKSFIVEDEINKVIGLLDASLKNNNISLEYEFDQTYIAYGFNNEFSQVILNIINNAKDALIEHKIIDAFIKITLEKEDNYILIRIEDNADGIPLNIIDKIFDPYFTTKEEGKGTGIGLYMSKTIIEENMHGKISVKSSDRGTIFTVAIPMYKA